MEYDVVMGIISLLKGRRWGNFLVYNEGEGGGGFLMHVEYI